jgi:hypothetical protein
MSQIITIGKLSPTDLITLSMIAEYFDSIGRKDLSDQIWSADTDDYDMTTKPEKGDALDAITSETQLVIALHLYGIDLVSARKPSNSGPYFYDRENGNLLKKCMDLKVPLVCWGDQPWLGVEDRTKLGWSRLYLYEASRKQEGEL